MVAPKKSIRLIQLAMLLVCAAALSSCGGNGDMITRFDAIEELPLWQRVTAIAVSTLISEDLACIMAGLLASRGVFTFGWALTASFLGIYLGDMLLYILGRIGGIALLRRVPFRWLIKESQIEQAESLFREHGAKIIFTSRLLPGSRLPVYAAAGVLNYSWWKFSLFMFLAGGLSAVILVSLSQQLGEVVIEWLEVYEAWALPVLAVLGVLTWITVKVLEIFATKRSRLVFLARSRKLWHRIRRSSRKN